MACSNAIQCRVLVVDFSSSEIFNMFKSSGYLATHCQSPQDVVRCLRGNDRNFDIVVFVYLSQKMAKETVYLDFLLANTARPVILISDDTNPTFIEAIRRGCSFCYLFPIDIGLVKVMWLHKFALRMIVNNSNYGTIINSNNNDNHEELGDQVDHGHEPEKKPRVLWTEELDRNFATAVERLGGLNHKNTIPKKILKEMNKMGIDGLSREHIASHLQRYRGTKRKEASTSGKNSSKLKYNHLSNNGVQNMIQYPNPDSIHRSNPLPDTSSNYYYRNFSLARTNMDSNIRIKAHHQSPSPNNSQMILLQQQANNYNNSQAVVINDQIPGCDNIFAYDQANPQNSQVDHMAHGHGREKKARLVWSEDLQRLGGHEKAKLKPMDDMGINNGLSRENIVSHLQNYRGSKSDEASRSSVIISSQLSINNNGLQNMIQHQNPGSVHRSNSQPDLSSIYHHQDFSLPRTNMESNIHIEAHHQNPNPNNLQMVALQQQANYNNSQAVVINDQIDGFKNDHSSVPTSCDNINDDEIYFDEYSFANDQADPQNSDRPFQN